MAVGFAKILIASIACLSGLRADWRDMLSGQSRLRNWFPDRPPRDISWSKESRDTNGPRVMSQNRLLVSYLVLPVWFYQRFQNPLALGLHVWMAMHDMLPPLLCQTDWNAVM